MFVYFIKEISLKLGRNVGYFSDILAFIILNKSARLFNTLFEEGHFEDSKDHLVIYQFPDLL